MKRIPLNWKDLSPRTQLGKLRLALDRLNAEPLLFPDAGEQTGSATVVHDDALAVLDEIDELLARVDALRALRDSRMKLAHREYAKLASFVQMHAVGNRSLIAASGFDEPPVNLSSRVQPMPQVRGLRVITTDDAGSLAAQWRRLRLARSYEIHITHDIHSGAWEMYRTITGQNRMRINSPSGQSIWVRVRAINRLGPGPWSQAVGRRVP